MLLSIQSSNISSLDQMTVHFFLTVDWLAILSTGSLLTCNSELRARLTRCIRPLCQNRKKAMCVLKKTWQSAVGWIDNTSIANFARLFLWDTNTIYEKKDKLNLLWARKRNSDYGAINGEISDAILMNLVWPGVNAVFWNFCKKSFQSLVFFLWKCEAVDYPVVAAWPFKALNTRESSKLRSELPGGVSTFRLKRILFSVEYRLPRFGSIAMAH